MGAGGTGGDFDLTNSQDEIRIAGLNIITQADEVSLTASFWSPTGSVLSSTTSDVTKIASLSDQWKAGVVDDVTATSPTSGKLDALIDVSAANKKFTGGATTDVLTFDIENQVTNSSAATPTSVTATLKGNFANVKSISAVTGTDAAVAWSINTAKTEATATYTTSTGTTAAEFTSNKTVATVTLNASTDKEYTEIAVGSFTLDAEVSYTATDGASKVKVLDNADAGKWALNSKSFTLNYIPFGPNTAPIVQATSTFSKDVEVDVSYLNPTTGKMVSLKNVATVKANSVTKLGAAVSEAVLKDFGGTSLLTKVVVSVYAPSGQIELFAGFKDTQDKDRLGLSVN